MKEERPEQANSDQLNFQMLADNIPSLAWIADHAGWIYWYNSKWYDYTGTSFEDMQGWGWMKVHHPDHINRVVERLQRSWDTGEPWEDVFPLRSAKGEYRWFLSRALPIKDKEGKVIRWFGVNTDVTEQRQAEQELLASSLRKDEFIAMLGHELRNPLATLLSSVEEDVSALEIKEREERNERMKRQVYRLKKIVDDLVDISRLNRGKIDLQTELVNLNEQVQFSINNLRRQYTARKHSIHVSVSETPLIIIGDPLRLQQIIENIFHNAIKYTPEGGRIELKTWKQDGHVFFSCCDNGPGIPADKLRYIFDPFTQFNISADRTDAGMGIGLSLVKQLTELHHGSIDVTTHADKQETCFTINFPEAKTEDIVTNTTAPEEKIFIPKRIIVAEDNDDLADILRKQFEKRGHSVIAVIHNGDEVKDAVLQLQPEVLLMDIGLPGKDGYVVASELSQVPHRLQMKVIAMSGYSPEPERLHLFDKFLLKPVQMHDLLHALSQ